MKCREKCCFAAFWIALAFRGMPRNDDIVWIAAPLMRLAMTDTALYQEGGGIMLGKIVIAFFALLALLLLWKSIVWPLWGQYLKKEITVVLLIILLFVLLHLLGSGLLELMRPFGEVFRR